MNTYQEYKETGIEWIGKIPKHWNLNKLKRISKIETGMTPSKKNDKFYINGFFPWIRPDELNQFKPIITSKIKISELGKKVSRIIPKNSILVCCIGSIGKMGFAGTNMTTNQQINSIFFNSKIIDYKFGKYLIYISNNELNKISNGNVVALVNKSQQSEIKLIVPPLQEQQQIAEYLDKKTQKIDKLIENTQTQIKSLQDYEKSLINKVVTKGLNNNVELKDSNIEWIGKIPKHWEVKRIGNLGNFSKGKGIRKDEVKKSGIPCIRYGEIYTEYNKKVIETKSFINEEVSKNSELIKEGSILIAGSGETIEDIGKSIVYLGTKKTFAGGDIVILNPNKKLSNNFTPYLFDSNYINIQKSKFARGQIVVHIYSKDIKTIKVALSPLQEQEQIAKYLDKKTNKLQKLIKNKENQVVLYNELRKTIINDAVTGKIKV